MNKAERKVERTHYSLKSGKMVTSVWPFCLELTNITITASNLHDINYGYNNLLNNAIMKDNY